jgi:hypothetical protein
LLGRKLLFLTHTGEVFLKRLNRLAAQDKGRARRSGYGGER